MTNQAPDVHELMQRLASAMPADRIAQGDIVTTFATDVYRRRELPVAVVRPQSVEELRAAVATITSADFAVFTRGGGASYTDGYLPSTPRSALLDMGGLDRIVEINQEDCYVTVEAGVTWAALKTALDALGLRTPFFGPFSGLAATVGGSVSQHSISHGSARYGTSAESVLAMDVVLASGELIRTGAAARGSAPFCRWYGPDLAGLFVGDCGTLGVKARITLPLLRRYDEFRCLSFGFAKLDDMAKALRAAGLERLEDEHFAIDAALSRGQIARQERTSKLTLIRNLWATAPSTGAAISQLLRTAWAGTRQMRNCEYSVHFIIDGCSGQDVSARSRRLQELMESAGGWSMVNTVPAVVRGMPFAPLINTLGPNGERWVPVHGHLPYSRVADFHRDLTAYFAQHATEMKQLGVWHGGMFMSVGSTAFLYEIALYWPGEQTAYHRKVVPAEYLASLPSYRDEAAVNEFVEKLKRGLIDLYSRHGATHFQLGKSYPYGSVLDKAALNLIRALKSAVDPKHLMNPGALDLPDA
ncbi:MAG: FAD-binding oxidoreductase [Steroidobacteraceae bacterium]